MRPGQQHPGATAAVAAEAAAGPALADAIGAAAAAYPTAVPWPHLVLDDVLDPDLVRAAAAEAAAYGALEQHSARSFRKAEVARPEGPAIATLLHALASPEITRQLALLTGAADLAPDPTHANAGLFVNAAGTFHRPHFDFARHPVTGLWHRANVLVYLGDWPADRGGELQLWQAPDRDSRGVVGDPVRITPRLGRVVVMETSRRALHGVTPVGGGGQDLVRLTLSSRFYSASPPAARASWRSDALRPRLASEPRWLAVPPARELARWLWHLSVSVPSTLRSRLADRRRSA